MYFGMELGDEEVHCILLEWEMGMEWEFVELGLGNCGWVSEWVGYGEGKGWWLDMVKSKAVWLDMCHVGLVRRR